MAGIVKAVFGSPPSDSPMGQRKPSMDDFSMGAHDDVNVRLAVAATTCMQAACFAVPVEQALARTAKTVMQTFLKRTKASKR